MQNFRLTSTIWSLRSHITCYLFHQPWWRWESNASTCKPKIMAWLMRHRLTDVNVPWVQMTNMLPSWNSSKKQQYSCHRILHKCVFGHNFWTKAYGMMILVSRTMFVGPTNQMAPFGFLELTLTLTLNLTWLDLDVTWLDFTRLWLNLTLTYLDPDLTLTYIDLALTWWPSSTCNHSITALTNHCTITIKTSVMTIIVLY